jgi:hypothetical protein
MRRDKLASGDVAVHSALLVITAVAILAALPCLVLAIIFVDDACVSIARTIRRVRSRRNPQIGPALEDIAADLHRLGTARAMPLQNRQMRAALGASYDRRLVLACAALGVREHLAALEGLDKDIERVRVEGALIEAGLVLRHVMVELGVDGKTDHK